METFYLYILTSMSHLIWIATPRNAQHQCRWKIDFLIFMYVRTVAFNAKHKKTHFTMKCNPLLWKELHLHWKFYFHFLFPFFAIYISSFMHDNLITEDCLNIKSHTKMEREKKKKAWTIASYRSFSCK